MEQSEDAGATANTPPVFVDDTGRRRRLTRRAGRILLLGVVGYLGLLGAGFARDPRLGPLGLPTFGLPALHPEPAPVVLGQTTARTDADASGAGEARGLHLPSLEETASQPQAVSRAGVPSGRGVPTGPPGGPATGPPTGLLAGTGGQQRPTPAPSGQGSATTTSSTTTSTGPTHPGNGSKSSTTTTTTVPASSTTAPTTTPTSPTPGQGSGAVSAKGPDGAGPPGQDRRATTTTTEPKR
jgi:hypothetical protein